MLWDKLRCITKFADVFPVDFSYIKVSVQFYKPINPLSELQLCPALTRLQGSSKNSAPS